MLTMFFGLIMFLCIVPTSVITFIQLYPSKWRDRNLILGVKNREEFRTGETQETVDKIYTKYRGMALKALIVICVISCILLFFRGMTLVTTVWTGFIFVALSAMMLPMLIGNKEMKDLKRRIGIGSNPGITYVDLSNAGAIRTLKPVHVLAPNLLGLALCVCALLVDLKVIEMRRGWIVGSFVGTGVTGVFFLMGLLITALAFLMDGLKNEVISADSDINANYNRANKKNMSRFMIMFLWVNAVYTALTTLSMSLFYSDMLFFVCLAIYMIFIMAGIALFVLRNRKIEERYAKETNILEDDDDYWIGGMIYYNPKDKRLNVMKRAGVGGTVNMGHPVGKLIGAIGGLSIVAAILSVVWLGMMESTPMKLRVDDEEVVCHHLRDEYVIRFDDIQEVSYCDLTQIQMSRVAGVGMETILKGDFIVENESGCRVFIWRATKHCIRIKTEDHTYYINSGSEEDTSEIYQGILKHRN